MNDWFEPEKQWSHLLAIVIEQNCQLTQSGLSSLLIPKMVKWHYCITQSCITPLLHTWPEAALREEHPHRPYVWFPMTFLDKLTTYSLYFIGGTLSCVHLADWHTMRRNNTAINEHRFRKGEKKVKKKTPNVTRWHFSGYLLVTRWILAVNFEDGD